MNGEQVLPFAIMLKALKMLAVVPIAIALNGDLVAGQGDVDAKAPSGNGPTVFPVEFTGPEVLHKKAP